MILDDEWEASKARELAETARRLSQLMHQPLFKKELLQEADRWDRHAAMLELGAKSKGYLSVVAGE